MGAKGPEQSLKRGQSGASPGSQVSKEGWGQLSEDLHCLAKCSGFCPGSEGEPWIAHVLRRNAVLWGGPPRVLGRVWLVTLRAELMHTLVFPRPVGPTPAGRRATPPT